MHSERRVIHSTGRYRWQLAVCGSDVTASRHYPNADGSVYFTTADFGLTTRDMGADNCSPTRVVAAYCKHSRTDAFDDLLARVRREIETAGEAREVAV
ncbi:hypothetical protein [Natrinema sp. DC36]|uniref:hypothetical protein n=1 Tax=Natrinema sp. DC36 TaxID=2878680 RepID=UPI001CEFC2B0|nr:hypothetical protein [Natrinema sp. DC36]